VYTVTVTAANGCTETSTVQVIYDGTAPNAGIASSGQLTCEPTSGVVLIASPGSGVTYTWSNGSNTESINVTLPNTYTVTITDTSNGCQATASFIVPEPVIPSQPIALDALHCEGEAPKTVVATGCTSGVIQWFSSPLGGTVIHTGVSFTPTGTTTTTYYVGCLENGCLSPLLPVTWFFYPPIEPSVFVVSDAVCEETEVVIGALPAQSGAPTGTSYMYEFFVNGVSQGAPSLNDTFTYIPQDNDSVTVKVYYLF
jgi:hypothetical protein